MGYLKKKSAYKENNQFLVYFVVLRKRNAFTHFQLQVPML